MSLPCRFRHHDAASLLRFSGQKPNTFESGFGEKHRDFGRGSSPYVDRRTDGHRDTVSMSQGVMNSPDWML
jgi:hypothetical protein